MDMENHEAVEKDVSQEGKRIEKKSGRKKLAVLGIVIGVLVVAYATVCTVAAMSDKAFAKTDVLGVDVSGMSRHEIEKLWRKKNDKVCKKTEIPLMIDGEKACRVSLADVGVSVTPEDAYQAVWDAGHSGNFITNGWNMIQSLWHKTSVMPKLTVDEKQLKACVKSVGKKLSYDPIDGAYRIDEEKTDGFYVTKPADGRTIDRDALQKALSENLSKGSLKAVECAYSVDKGKPINLKKVYNKIHAPENARYNKETGGIIASKDGVVFKVDEAKDLLKKAEAGSEFVVPAKRKGAAITADELRQVLFRDRLGSYTTHVGGTPQRINNVRLAAEKINGYVLNSGEDFYYNQAVGQRTAERGFQAAPAYVGGKTVDEIGGGICQVSSTLYYATLLSNLQIVLRYAHQFAPAYITFGCDATVSWGGPDYAFRNNTDYPIKIVTSYDGGSLTVALYGTKLNDNYVQMVSKTLSSTDYKVVREETSELPKGVEQVDQTPYTGYYVETYRNVYAGDGTLLSSNFEASSNYESRNEIIKVGTRVTAPKKANTAKNAG